MVKDLVILQYSSVLAKLFTRGSQTEMKRNFASGQIWLKTSSYFLLYANSYLKPSKHYPVVFC